MAVQEPDLAAQTDAAAPSPLLLPSLEIKNFRAFRHLTIEKLGRVNLITGKNNVGKSSLLEALWLYARRGSPAVLRELLNMRDEFLPNEDFTSDDYDDTDFDDDGEVGAFVKFESLFYGRPTTSKHLEDVEDLPSVQVGLLENDKYEHVNLRVLFRWISPNDPGAKVIINHNKHTPLKISNNSFYLPYIEVLYGSQEGAIYSVADITEKTTTQRTAKVMPSQLVRPTGLSSPTIGRLWDRITLTASEKQVLTSLRLIAPNLVRLSLKGGNDKKQERVPYVKMSNFTEPVPLRSLGDGMSRLLGITLALVNVQGGVLLIDEVENGLHYSVLPDVWRLIFQAARRLNVQVFATTHSWDCIEAFQEAAAEDDDPGSGVLVRLDNKGGDVSATVFDERRLAVVTREGIEVR